MKPYFRILLTFSFFFSFSNPLLGEKKGSLVTEILSQTQEELPPPPNTPPPNDQTRLPNNKTRPGGGLSQEPHACQAQQGQFTALIPESNDPHPPLTLFTPLTILLYFPDENSAIQQVEFWVNSQDEKTRIMDKLSLPLPDLPGILSISLPDDVKNAFEVGKNYHWFVKVSCQNQTHLAVNGWVQRVDNSQEKRLYDSLAEVAYQRSKNPNHSAINSQWESLLEQINASELVDKPIYFIDLNH